MAVPCNRSRLVFSSRQRSRQNKWEWGKCRRRRRNGIVLECLQKNRAIIVLLCADVNDVNRVKMCCIQRRYQSWESEKSPLTSHRAQQEQKAKSSSSGGANVSTTRDTVANLWWWWWLLIEPPRGKGRDRKIHQLSYVRIKEILREKFRLSGERGKASFFLSFTFECFVGADRGHQAHAECRNGTNIRRRNKQRRHKFPIN